MSTEAAAGVDRPHLAVLIAKLRLIPDDVRQFRHDADWAWRKFRLGPAALADLVEQGLPVRGTDAARRFDSYDLFNCAMQLGLGPSTRAARRYWPAALRRADEGRRSRYELRFQARCPSPGHAAGCRYVFALPGGREHVESVRGPDAAQGAVVEVTPRIDWPQLPGSARALLAQATRDVEFVVLREELKRDISFIRTAGLADCAGLTELVVQEATAREIPVRKSFGLIVVPPFAVKHFWAELRTEDVWVPVDPVLVQAMTRWRVLDPADWDPYRSIGPIVTRIAAEEVPLARHDDVSVPYTIPSRILPEPA
ncbi:hypothetical protein [Micromonospora sp. RP3T]|uniref:hypothetical protein n=1 Tax=Micromonospora sp. RP3T TaxID=2135446 RepID=UPI003D724289